MKKEARDLIKAVIDLDINEISLFTGYRGDLMLRVTSVNSEVIKAIHRICTQRSITAEIKYNNSRYAHEIYCSFEQEDIYRIKRHDE